MPRVIRPEKLDQADEETAHRNLNDLRRINRWFGGHWVLRSVFSRFYGAEEAFSVLDIGAASGDMGAALHRKFPNARVTSLDLSLRNLRDGAPPKLVADAFHLPFAAGSFDIVTCHLFLHHFDDAAVVELLGAMGTLARRGLIAIDLERHGFARAFLPATRWLFGWNDITLHDGPVSVDAAFLPEELEALARRSGLGNITVRRHLPWFRLSLAADKRGGLDSRGPAERVNRKS